MTQPARGKHGFRHGASHEEEKDCHSNVVSLSSEIVTSGAASNADSASVAVDDSKHLDIIIADIFSLTRQNNLQEAMKLLHSHPQLWTAVDENKQSLLHWGALLGNLEFVMHACDKSVHVDVQAANMQTPLMWAVHHDQIPVARLLLDRNADIRHHDFQGATPFMIAIQRCSYRSALFLMHRGKSSLVSDRDKNGCTAVHWAAYTGDITALKLLEYFEADLQALDNALLLPLHRAVCNSKMKVVEFLMDRLSDPLQENAKQESCLDIANRQSNAQMQKLIKKKLDRSRKAGVRIDVEIGRGVYEDISSGNAGIINMLYRDKLFQKLFPVYWIVCCSVAFFHYLVDLRSTSYQAAPIASQLFELGLPLSVGMFCRVALMDPGRLPAKIRGNSGVEELQRRLDRYSPGEDVPDFTQLCTTTWVWKDLRTSYCSQTGACVEEFDHYCIWLNTAIGKNNHRLFLCLALVELATQICHLQLLVRTAFALVPFSSYEKWGVTMRFTYPILHFFIFEHILTLPFILFMILYHFRLVAKNLTTREAMKSHKYKHFWISSSTSQGKAQITYHNPFHKGSAVKNCLDFWWSRRRSQTA